MGRDIDQLYDSLEAARIEAYRPAPGPGGLMTEAPTRAITLVAEGDSWFSYFPPPDELDALRTGAWPDRRYSIFGKPKAGAYLNDMVYGGRDMVDKLQAIEEHRPDGFLFSGGGNDIAGDEFFCMLYHRRAAVVDNDGIPIVVNANVLRGLVQEVFAEAFRDMIGLVRRKAAEIGMPQLPIVVHGYDYAVPDGRGWGGGMGPLPGPWLDPSLTRKGYERGVNDQQRLAAVCVLIDAFNEMLIAVAASEPGIHYVNVRNTLAYPDQWANELHPSREGFRKVAKKFHDVLVQAIP